MDVARRRRWQGASTTGRRKIDQTTRAPISRLYAESDGLPGNLFAAIQDCLLLISREEERWTQNCRSLHATECGVPTKREKRSVRLRRAGGQVSEGFIRRGVERARHLLWNAGDQGLIGTAALKTPGASHWKGEFKKAVCSLDRRSFPLEFGYLFVVPECGGRGHRSSLLEKAIALATGVGLFATVRTEIERMKSMLVKRGWQPLPVGSR